MPQVVRFAGDNNNDGRWTMDEMRHTTYEDAALEEVLMGGIASRRAGRKLVLGPDRGSRSVLTGRERQVLRWIVDGKTNKRIAALLNRSTRTVEYHRNRLMRKLDAHNAAELVKKAMEMTSGTSGDD